MDVGMIGRSGCRVQDRIGKVLRRRWPAFRDIGDDVMHALARFRAPEQCPCHWSRCRSMITCISAIT
jgi:hypothetical protein